ncbi:hypothetical protein [Dubosiella newyorkensis]
MIQSNEPGVYDAEVKSGIRHEN